MFFLFASRTMNNEQRAMARVQHVRRFVLRVARLLNDDDDANTSPRFREFASENVSRINLSRAVAEMLYGDDTERVHWATCALLDLLKDDLACELNRCNDPCAATSLASWVDEVCDDVWKRIGFVVPATDHVRQMREEAPPPPVCDY
jgi:hypothetical protein